MTSECAARPGTLTVVPSALTGSDARFWNGTTWIDASRVLALLPARVTFTQRYEAGGWLVGGDNATLAVIDTRGIGDTIQAPAANFRFSSAERSTG